ncbi:MAG: hypothetical protein JOY92_04965 [Verrucomicrobia bacterium]|nr:hypothetical protein [Verrucomicrobiota bacterium]
MPGGIEPSRRGGRFENRQKTCCPASPGRISPYFACLIEAGLIQVAAHAFIRIVAEALVQIAPGEFIRIVACDYVQVAPRERTRAACRELVANAQFQEKRTANGCRWPPRRPVLCP